VDVASPSISFVSRARRPTPGRFETRVVTADVDPEIRIRYKSDKVKAYFNYLQP